MQTTLIILLVLGQLARWLNACPAMANQEKERYKFCETQLDNKNHLYVQCYVYALTETRIPFLPNSTIGISVVSTFKTAQPVQLTTNQNIHQCLQMGYGRVRKLDPVEDQKYFNQSNKYYIPQLAMLPLMSVKSIDFYVRFHADDVVGMVNYSPSCIGETIRLGTPLGNGNVNVSQCVMDVFVLESIAMPGNALHYDNSNILNKDALSIILMYINDFWLKNYNGTVQSLSLTLQEPFDVFPRDAMAMLKDRLVEALHFPNNLFEAIYNHDFPPFTTLKILDFRNCRLKSIKSLAFQSMTNLIYVNLAGNQLKAIPRALTPLVNLEILNMSSNRIASGRFNLAPNILGHFSNLKVLDLSYMPLTSAKDIGSSKQPILKYLKVLNLTHTSLSNFPQSLNGVFPNLETLILSYNSLTSEKSLMNNTWDQLRTLHLNNNNFNDDANYCSLFNHFPQLRLLNLANNNIKKLSTFSLRYAFDHSRLLNLSGNSIRLWNEPMFSVVQSNPADIDLRRNNITEVTPAMLTDFSQLNNIYLSENPFDCNSCQLENFKGWLKDHRNSTDHDTSPFRCVFPKQSVGLFLTDVIVDPDLCLFNWLVNVVIPLLVISVTGSAIAFLLFYYRWHLRYFWYIWQAKWSSARRTETLNLDSPPEYRYEAFVSYSGSDSEWVVEHLIPMIEEEEPKLHLCVHERDFLIGEAVINNVIKCIDISRKSIFLISNSFIQSQWCQWELQMAQHKLFEDKKDVLVLIVLEELVKSDIPRELQRLMATRTYHVWPGNHNAAACRVFWARLRQCIGPCHCLQKQLEDRGIFFR